MNELFGINPVMVFSWLVAIVSLLAIVYLFITWPSPQRESSGSGSAGMVVGSGNQLLPPDRRSAPGKRQQVVSPLDDFFNNPSSVAAQKGKHSLLDSDFRPVKRDHKAKATLKDRIIRAGIYEKGGMQTFQMVRVILTLSTLLLGPLLALVTPLTWDLCLIIGGLASLAGYLAPSFWLDWCLRLRQIKMRRALPDALDLITVCMQGGLSFPSSLARVGRELGTAHPMLATELSIVERETQMGLTSGDAMRQLAARFNMEELRSLSAVISQAEKFGGSVTRALKTYAESLRVKRKQFAEEKAQKAAIKLLFPTLLCIFPGIFVVILGPTAIRLYELIAGNPWGQ